MVSPFTLNYSWSPILNAFFELGPGQGCGGFINLTDVKTIRSPNLANLDCGWNIVAPRDYQIVVTVNKLDILTDCGQGNKTNSTCDCMFLEVTFKISRKYI